MGMIFKGALLTDELAVFCGVMLRSYAYGLFKVIFVGPYSLARRPATCHLTFCPTVTGWLVNCDFCIGILPVFLSIPGLYNEMLFFAAPSIRRDCWSHSSRCSIVRMDGTYLLCLVFNFVYIVHLLWRASSFTLVCLWFILTVSNMSCCAFARHRLCTYIFAK